MRMATSNIADAESRLDIDTTTTTTNQNEVRETYELVPFCDHNQTYC